MNYRHAFHAGSFADVFKHAVLARILVHLRKKEQTFRVIDTHAGAGLYDLEAEEARRTGEWREGIGKLLAAPLAPDIRALLAPYLDAVAGINPAEGLRRYPGSPLIALALMRPQDRLTACELEPNAAAALATHLRRDRRAKAVAIDGWVALNAYVPPTERRGAVVIDPPFETKDEFTRLADGFAAAYRKWATGTYVLWYPIKDRRGSDALASRLRASAIGKILRAELAVDPAGDSGRLMGSGLLIVNPPWRLAGELERLLPALARIFGSRRGFILDWLATEK